MFTGGGGAGNEAIWRLWNARYTLFFADARPEFISPEIPQDRCIAIPIAISENFAEAVKTVCRDLRIDVLVPGVDEELQILGSLKGEVGWPIIMLPDNSFIELMLDKQACAEALHSNGLSAPLTLPVSRADEIGFPLIIKPRSGRGSRGVMKIDHPSQVSAYLTLYGVDPTAVIAQEWIRGQEYTIFVCPDRQSTLRAVVPVRVDQKRGVTIRAETEAHPAIVEYAQRFQATFQPNGPYNIQCMVTEDGVVVPFEVNPRISTTFCMSIAAGVEAIDLFMGHINPSFLCRFSEGIKLRRHWKNYTN